MKETLNKIYKSFLFLIVFYAHKYIEIVELIKKSKSLILKTLFIYIYGITFRCKYYFIWTLSSAFYLINGYKVENVFFKEVEFSEDPQQSMRCWNFYMGSFLRQAVFERIKNKNVILASLATFITSASIHGANACYFIFFLTMSVAIPFLKNQKTLIEKYCEKRAAKLINVAFKALFISYASIPFCFLSLEKTVEIYKSLFWYGHIILILFQIPFLINGIKNGTYKNAIFKRK